MLEFARWKYILVAVVALLALAFAAPNFFGQDDRTAGGTQGPRRHR